MQQKPLPPTRTVLVTEFKDTKEFDKLIDLLPKELVFEHYSLPNASCVFVTFFDVRSSMHFINNFRKENDMEHLNFNYTISKNEIPRNNEEASDKHHQSSVLIHFKNIDFDCQDSTVLKFLEQFGKVREIRLSKPQQKILEFYDMRMAKKAVEALDGTPFGTGIIKIKMVWDMMMLMKQEYLKKTDAILRPLLSETGLDEVKRLKTEKKSNPNVNIFIDEFDKFIIENIDKIEFSIKNNRRMQ